MKFLNYILFSLTIFLVGCGHNILTDYRVHGIDLSVPLFGYPFGIKIGVVEVNSNAVRGNSSYSVHSNSGIEAGTGAAQKSQVIQFSSNTQINEGNVQKILTDEHTPEQTKTEFVKQVFGTDKQSPNLPSVSSRTLTAASITSDNKSIHDIDLTMPDPIVSLETPKTWISNLLSYTGAFLFGFFGKSTKAKIFYFVVKMVVYAIIIIFIIDIFKKIKSYFKERTKKEK